MTAGRLSACTHRALSPSPLCQSPTALAISTAASPCCWHTVTPLLLRGPPLASSCLSTTGHALGLISLLAASCTHLAWLLSSLNHSFTCSCFACCAHGVHVLLVRYLMFRSVSALHSMFRHIACTPLQILCSAVCICNLRHALA